MVKKKPGILTEKKEFKPGSKEDLEERRVSKELRGSSGKFSGR